MFPPFLIQLYHNTNFTTGSVFGEQVNTRWKLRSAIRIVNKTLNVMKLDKHPDKTFIGKVERGFDFLGYFLKPEMVNVAISTLKRFAKRITQLYGQGADYLRIGEYVRHWLKWVRSGIGELAELRVIERIKKTPTSLSV